MPSIFTELNKAPYFLTSKDYRHQLLNALGGDKTDMILETLQARLEKHDITVITDIVTIITSATMVSFTVETNVGKYTIIISRISNFVRGVLMRNTEMIDTLLEIYLDTPNEITTEVEPVPTPSTDDEGVGDPIGGNEHGSS